MRGPQKTVPTVADQELVGPDQTGGAETVARRNIGYAMDTQQRPSRRT
jgi:hypothetical protein